MGDFVLEFHNLLGSLGVLSELGQLNVELVVNTITVLNLFLESGNFLRFGVIAKDVAN